MNEYDAVKAIIKSLKGDEYVIACNGFISRYVHGVEDRPRNFYMLGSMGMSSSIGLGLAIAQPNKKVIVLSGDGNILMGLGTLSTIGYVAPTNLIQVVLDNQAHESTGGQHTSSLTTKLDLVAEAAGFKNVRRANSADELSGVVKELLETDGPSFILSKVEQGEVKTPRVAIGPEEIKDRFMKSVLT